MAVMKTPGVYIVEKNAFPNSVVEVATAVPAFVGHTEWADNKGTPLALKPWPISNMVEYQQYFGGPSDPRFRLTPADGLAAQFQAMSEPDQLDSKKGYALEQVNEGPGQIFGMYNALRHFFQNGGGRSYIVSVGSYRDDLESGRLLQGIDALKKEQEPTMLLVPEAVRLEVDDCKDVQQAMLNHCGNEMRNRVAILDVWNGDKPREFPKEDPIAGFRDRLGIGFLDYAAAYYPWLNTSVVGEKEIDYKNIQTDSLDLLCMLLRADLNLPAQTSLDTKSKTYALQKEVADIKTDFTAQVIAEARRQRDEATDKAATAILSANKDAREKVVADAKAANKDAAATAADLAAFDAAHPTPKTADERKAALDAERQKVKNAAKAAALAATPALSIPEAEKAAEDKANVWELTYDNPLGSAALEAGVKARRALLHKTLANASGIYKTVMTEMRRQLNVLPPSSAMAGIYTMVDNTRGVWKAPANVSLNGVISPTVSISHEQQEDLNVCAQGKSINAIRSFQGEGVLVWGARTLDGNSLDWRYINVRRTMIMLEESCRLAAKAMVFEPNTANTWVAIKSMVSNFLTGIWKRGGLMGAVPEDAFSVHVGLGETMTPNDVLEGILRVTVLVAMVRPAEFIEITFQQQMPKS